VQPSAHSALWLRAPQPQPQKLAAASADGRARLADELRTLSADQDEAIGRNDDTAFALADRAFHERLVAAAGNQILRGYYVALRDRQVRMNLTAFRRDPGRTRRNLADHHRILDALVAGDAAGLATQIRGHIHAIGDVLDVRPGHTRNGEG
jgi:DNA-binding FadR family transcriptional regulator